VNRVHAHAFCSRLAVAFVVSASVGQGDVFGSNRVLLLAVRPWRNAFFGLRYLNNLHCPIAIKNNGNLFDSEVLRLGECEVNQNH
jgi:hypothetical protein